MILYEGPSMLNGKPIVAIATGVAVKSKNAKTGPMVQTWILDATEEPHHAAKSGADASVCGDCKLRPSDLGVCYVTTFQGPLAIHRAWKRGGYQAYNQELLTGQAIRFGAYGDPAAVPFHIWDAIGLQAVLTTGYTHAWRYCDPLHKHYCMASCETEADALEARSRGWRTFRVTEEPGDKALSNEVICPASEEAGQKIRCIDCGVCDGTSRRLKSHIVIHAHGSKAKNLSKLETSNGAISQASEPGQERVHQPSRTGRRAQAVGTAGK